MRAATETRDGMGDRSDQRVRLLSFFNSFYSPLLLMLLLSGCLFSTEYNDRRSGMDRDQRGQDNALFAPSLEGRVGGGQRVYVFRCYLFSIHLFSSSHCSCFPIISFFAKINNRRCGTGPDRTDSDGDRNAGRDRGAMGRYVSCNFCSLLYSFLLLALLLF